MSVTLTTELSPAELVDRAVALQPLIAGHAAQADRERRVPDEVIAAIKDAGLLNLGIPRQFGGRGATIRSHMEVLSALAVACGSTGWVVQNLNGACMMVGATYSDQALEDLWGDGNQALMCGTATPVQTAQRVEGGLRLTGKCPFVSGIYYAQYSFVGVPLVNDQNGNPVDVGLGLVPVDTDQIEDTWHVAGMRGTGSNTIVLNDVFIPNERVLGIIDYADAHDDRGLPLYERWWA